MIAALYVQKGGAYYGLPDVDPWDIERDARLYPGPHPVVAHPPCSRWCKLAGLVRHRYGHEIGDDGGCFEAALRSVREWGGVLEHPADSIAWERFGLPRPRPGGWLRAFCGGWVTEVAQQAYGHVARKRTWLYVFGTEHLPELRQEPKPRTSGKVVSRLWVERRGMGKGEAIHTPPAFRDLLVGIAASCKGGQVKTESAPILLRQFELMGRNRRKRRTQCRAAQGVIP